MIFQATWSTGCPQEEDIRLGAPGARSENSEKTKKGKERNRLKMTNIKGKKKNKNKATRILTITEDNVDNIHIDIHGDS